MTDSETNGRARGPEDEKGREDPLDPNNSSISDASRALEAAYNSYEVTLPTLILTAVIVAALVGIIAALLLFSGN